jgi:type II secretory pathway predicted ATPase ExeA
MTATDSRVCVLVESADGIMPEVMLALHSLTAADAALSRGANVILTTTRPPETLLATPEMLAFNQRVCLRRRIGTLTDAEVLEYLRFKLRLGGANPDEILEPEFASLLEEYSGGIIRVIDNLLEAALRQAAAAGLRKLTADVIVDVAEQSFGLTRLAPAVVDELLTATGQSQQPAAFDAEEIPTLTEFLRPAVGRRELRQDARRTARR